MIPDSWTPMVTSKEEDFSLVGFSLHRSRHRMDWSFTYTGDGKPFYFVDFLWLLVHIVPLCFLFFLGVLVYNEIV